MMENKTNNYNEGSIQVLEGLEAVRKRPSMYIGNIDVEGLHHLVYEVVDNSIDEAMAGFCDTIRVTIHTDNSVTVIDNGRGIPVGIHKTEKIPAVEVVMTKLHAGGKFDNDSYKVSGGLHGVGISVVNALSETIDVEICSDGNMYRQSYSRGKKTSELEMVGETTENGTKIHFKPDLQVLNTDNFIYEVLVRRLRELAFLNKDVRIRIEDERSDNRDEFHYDGGIKAFVEYVNRRHTPLHSPIFIEGLKNDVQMEVAIQYNDTFKEKIFSFANNINTVEGGFHLSGFKAALTRTLNQYAANGNLPKNMQAKISGDDVREGMTAVISVRIKSPQFEGQTKTKLGNSEVKGLVESLINEKLSIFLEEHPAIGKKIMAKALDASRARDAAKRARDLVRKQGALTDTTLPGKLADCQISEPSQREIFLVEGDSAGGSAKQGRDRRFQAILPLKGKILNVEKARFDKILRSEEIKNIITALGTGVGSEEYNIDNIRYHKTIIMTDADVDGSHIRTLLLTFFYRQMPEIVAKGYLYIAQPPLFRVGKGKKALYLKDEDDFNDHILKRVCSRYNLTIGPDNQKVSDHHLYLLVCDLAEYHTVLKRLEHRGIPAPLVETLIEAGVEDKLFLQDREKMVALQKKLDRRGYVSEGVLWHDDRELFEIIIDLVKNDQLDDGQAMRLDVPVKVGRGLIYSNDYQKIVTMAKKIEQYNRPPFSVVSIENENNVLVLNDHKNLIDHLIEEGKKGMGVQRYKGLGEMNPDQLWDTTMNPEQRTLLQIKVEDAVEADEIFTVLMGEEVEPRREFIQSNALEVSTLDI